MPKADVNGCRLNYTQMGNGPDTVLIHGLAANLAFWNLPLLRRLAARRRVTVFDLRGHGYSDLSPSGYSSAQMAADLLGLLDHLAIDRAHLVGHSFGGTVALQATIDAPGRIASLTLADVRVAALQPTLRPADFPHWDKWWSAFRNAGIVLGEDQSLDFTLLELLAAPRWRSVRRQLADGSRFVPFEGWTASQRGADRWLRLLATTTARADFQSDRGPTIDVLSRVEHPTLAIYGQYSHCLPSAEGLRQHLRRCRMVLSPASGHFHPAVRPEFFADQVLAFTDEVESSQGRTPSG